MRIKGVQNYVNYYSRWGKNKIKGNIVMGCDVVIRNQRKADIIGNLSLSDNELNEVVSNIQKNGSIPVDDKRRMEDLIQGIRHRDYSKIDEEKIGLIKKYGTEIQVDTSIINMIVTLATGLIK